MSPFGVVYAVFGHERYHRQASLSLKSLREFSPGTPACVFTDRPNWAGYRTADEIRTITKPEKCVFQWKMRSLLESPFARSLYLDGDTYIVRDIAHVFEVLEHYDIGVTHCHVRAKRLDNVKNHPAFCDLPKAFTNVQGGFLLSRKTEATDRFWQNVLDAYTAGGYRDDQLYIRRELWMNREVTHYVLPPEYNLFRVEDVVASRRYLPYIIHYTTFKAKDVDRVVRQKLAMLLNSGGVAFVNGQIRYLPK